MLLEAVPNLSLGSSSRVLEAAIQRLEDAGSPGARLLDVHSDPDHNRSVLTMAGAPAPLARLVDRLVDVLAREGSLVGHEGVHPRVGLLDVLPFVPLADARTGDAVRVARWATARLAREGVPVYGYGAFATRPEHRALAGIRRGIHWPGHAAPPALEPDAGPRRFHARMGAACVGVRELLVAYNVLLDATDLEAGQRIARSLRPANGGLPGVQALAFALESRSDRVQVSTNITDVTLTTPADVYQAVQRGAREEGIDVLEGEIVGLAPAQALPEDPRRAGLGDAPESLEANLARAGLPPHTGHETE